jgi:hypothetical protein
MNWDGIGAVGEVIGALAVLITLIYLATQIRQSNRIGVTASEAQFRMMAQTVNRSIIEIPEGDPFLDELLKKDPNYNPAQRVKAIQFARLLANLWAFADSSYRNQLIDEFAYQVSIDDIRIIFHEYPGLPVAFKYLVEEYEVKKWADVSPMWQELISELDKRGYMQ